MSRPAARDDEALRRLTEAAAWRVRLTEDGADTSEAFEHWLADPLNEAAWDQVQAPWREVGEKATSPELMAARAGALARARRSGRMRWTSTARGRIAASVAALFVVAGGYGGLRWVDAQPDVYRTTLGERRVVPLPDGSRVSLDSGSKVRIRYTDDARKLELVAGQARFDVAKDVRRPFSVTARDQTVVATGTAFNVDLLGRQVLVTLIEGHVFVVKEPPKTLLRPAQDAAAPRPIELEAGEQLVSAPATAPRIRAISIERATSWETGQLTFADEPLAAVAERVSRYAPEPITVAPDAAAMRVSGVFKAGDVASFVDMVTSYLPVEADAAASGEITLRARS